MGSRHNRKRTRSRPRNRFASFANNYSYSFQDLSSFSSSTPALRNRPLPASHWERQYNSWQLRLASQQHNSYTHSSNVSKAAEHSTASSSDYIRMFGGNVNDEAGLCAPMLQVVLDLFDGRIDYEDD